MYVSDQKWLAFNILTHTLQHLNGPMIISSNDICSLTIQAAGIDSIQKEYFIIAQSFI